MKKTLLACCLLLLLTSIQFLAAESEPNDVRGDADKLNFNSSNIGAIGVPGDVDWWKVTTNVDGELDITLTVSNSLYCYFQLYDNNATTLLVSDYTNGTKTIDEDGLAPGTYYLHLCLHGWADAGLYNFQCVECRSAGS